MNRLATSQLLLMVALLAHTVDHEVNQPARAVPGLAGVAAGLGFALLAAGLILAISGHRRGPEVALLAGAGTVAGFVLVHLLPQWSGLSDPYWDFDPNAISWILIALPVGLALWVSLVAGRELRRPSSGAATSG